VVSHLLSHEASCWQTHGRQCRCRLVTLATEHAAAAQPCLQRRAQTTNINARLRHECAARLWGWVAFRRRVRRRRWLVALPTTPRGSPSAPIPPRPGRFGQRRHEDRRLNYHRPGPRTPARVHDAGGVADVAHHPPSDPAGPRRKPSPVMVRNIEAGLGEDPGTGTLLGRGRSRQRILLGHHVFDPVATSWLRPVWRR
jgi:hypothetical protein